MTTMMRASGCARSARAVTGYAARSARARRSVRARRQADAGYGYARASDAPVRFGRARDARFGCRMRARARFGFGSDTVPDAGYARARSVQMRCRICGPVQFGWRLDRIGLTYARICRYAPDMRARAPPRSGWCLGYARDAGSARMPADMQTCGYARGVQNVDAPDRQLRQIQIWRACATVRWTGPPDSARRQTGWRIGLRARACRACAICAPMRARPRARARLVRSADARTRADRRRIVGCARVVSSVRRARSSRRLRADRIRIVEVRRSICARAVRARGGRARAPERMRLRRCRMDGCDARWTCRACAQSVTARRRRSVPVVPDARARRRANGQPGPVAIRRQCAGCDERRQSG